MHATSMKIGSEKTNKAQACALMLLSLLILLIPCLVYASTASNTVIRNTVTVNYQDTAGSDLPAVSDSVDITVSLVAAAATLSAPADGTTDPNTAEVYTYTITTNANGPDTYAVSTSVDSETAGLSGSTATPSTASIVLGATTAASSASTGATAITVPNDAASNASINGIEAGDTLVIGGNEYTVSSITDNGGTVGGTSTITLSSALTTDVAAGDLIYESQTFTMTVTPGTVTTATDKTIVVTTTTDGSGDAATDETSTTVQVASLTVLKEVSADGSTWTSADSLTFAPSATVYYRVTVTNGGTSDATSVVLTDAQPAYTTYVSGSARASTGVSGMDVAYAGAATTLTDTDAGDDNYDFNVTTSDTATYSIGTIASGNAVQFFFQVTVN